MSILEVALIALTIGGAFGLGLAHLMYSLDARLIRRRRDRDVTAYLSQQLENRTPTWTETVVTWTPVERGGRNEPN